MLTDVGSHKGLALGHFIELFNHVLRHDVVFLLVTQGFATTPLFDLLPPVRHFRISLEAAVEQLEHLINDIVDVTDDRHIDLDPLGDRRRIDVDVDDTTLLTTEMLGIADDSVVKASTDRQDHVGVVHCVVGFESAVHAEHANKLAVGGRIATQPHQGIGHREIQLARQLRQLFSRVGKNYATAGVDDRTLGFLQNLHGLLDLTEMPLDHRVVRTHLDRLRIVELAHLRRDVLRDIDDDRTRTTGGGNVERLLDGQRQILDILDQEVVLDAGAGNTDGIALLESILTDVLGRHLTGDHDHRNRVHVGGRNAGHGIGDAGTGGHQSNTHALR